MSQRSVGSTGTFFSSAPPAAAAARAGRGAPSSGASARGASGGSTATLTRQVLETQELRLEVSRLKAQLRRAQQQQAQSEHSPRKPPGPPPAVAPPPGPGAPSAEEAAHLAAEVKRLLAENKRLRQGLRGDGSAPAPPTAAPGKQIPRARHELEAVVLGALEREEVYKHVYADLQGRVEALERQNGALLAATQRQAEALELAEARAAAEAERAERARAALEELPPAERQARAQARRVAASVPGDKQEQAEAEAQTAPAGAPNRGAGRAGAGVKRGAATHAGAAAAVAEETAEEPMTLRIARGAAALRDVSAPAAAGARGGRRAGKRPGETPEGGAAAGPPRKRARTTAGTSAGAASLMEAYLPRAPAASAAADGAGEGAASASASSSTAPAAAPAAPVAPATVLGDYLRLMASTAVVAQQRALARHLLSFFGGDLGRLAHVAVTHLHSSGAGLALPLPLLWSAVRDLLAAQAAAPPPADVAGALRQALLARLMAAVGPARPDGEHAAAAAAAAALARALRFVLLQAPAAPRPAELQHYAYEIAAAGLRDTSGAAGAALAAAALRGLCGHEAATAEVLRLHAAADRQPPLPLSPVTYALQAALGRRLLAHGRLDEWRATCAALGWGLRPPPLGPLVRRALAAAAGPEAVLLVRLAVLADGPALLQAAADAAREAPSGDALFAAVLAASVLDSPPAGGGARWLQAASFLRDFLRAASGERCCSPVEMAAALTETHVLAARALVTLALAAPGTADAADCAAVALVWVRRHDLACATAASRGFPMPNPLRDTPAGQQLLELVHSC